jgi:hypothetical protein
MAGEFHITFDGLIAGRHVLPMNQLGNSLVGLDKIINSGLIFLAYGRAPKRGERFDLVLNAREPRVGSVEIVAHLQQMPWLLPIVQEFIVAGGVDMSYRFASYVLTRLGGRPMEAERHLEALVQMNRDHLEARGISDEQWRLMIIQLVDKMIVPARQAVLPIGSGAQTLALGGTGIRDVTLVDEPMASVIRSKENDEVGDMVEMEFRVDGIIHHNRQLKVHDPNDAKRFITAEIRDPVFETVPNAYSEAAANMSTIRVMAKPVFRNGELHRVYVMDLLN